MPEETQKQQKKKPKPLNLRLLKLEDNEILQRRINNYKKNNNGENVDDDYDGVIALGCQDSTEQQRSPEIIDPEIIDIDKLSALIKVHNNFAKQIISTLNEGVQQNTIKGYKYNIELTQDTHKITIIDKKTGDLYIATFTKKGDNSYEMNCSIDRVNASPSPEETEEKKLFETMCKLVEAEEHKVNLIINGKEIDLFKENIQDQENIEAINVINTELKRAVAEPTPAVAEQEPIEETSSTTDKIAKRVVVVSAAVGGACETFLTAHHTDIEIDRFPLHHPGDDFSTALAVCSAGTAIYNCSSHKPASVVTPVAVGVACVGTAIGACRVQEQYHISGLASDIGVAAYLGTVGAKAGTYVAGENYATTGAVIGAVAGVTVPVAAEVINEVAHHGLLSLGGVTGIANCVKDVTAASLNNTELSEEKKGAISNGVAISVGAAAIAGMCSPAAPIIAIGGASYAAGSAVVGLLSQCGNYTEQEQRGFRIAGGFLGATGACVAIGCASVAIGCAGVATAPVIAVASAVSIVATTASIAYKIYQNKAEWIEVIQAAGTELNVFHNFTEAGAGDGTTPAGTEAGAGGNHQTTTVTEAGAGGGHTPPAGTEAGDSTTPAGTGAGDSTTPAGTGAVAGDGTTPAGTGAVAGAAGTGAEAGGGHQTTQTGAVAGAAGTGGEAEAGGGHTTPAVTEAEAFQHLVEEEFQHLVGNLQQFVGNCQHFVGELFHPTHQETGAGAGGTGGHPKDPCHPVTPAGQGGTGGHPKDPCHLVTPADIPITYPNGMPHIDFTDTTIHEMQSDNNHKLLMVEHTSGDYKGLITEFIILDEHNNVVATYTSEPTHPQSIRNGGVSSWQTKYSYYDESTKHVEQASHKTIGLSREDKVGDDGEHKVEPEICKLLRDFNFTAPKQVGTYTHGSTTDQENPIMFGKADVVLQGKTHTEVTVNNRGEIIIDNVLPGKSPIPLAKKGDNTYLR